MGKRELEADPLIGTILLLYRTVLHEFRRKELGLTKSQLLVFCVLRFCGSVTMTQLAELLASAKEQTTRSVAPLVELGYVERYADLENRTRVHIRMTGQGRAFFDAYMQTHITELNQMMERRLSAAEQQELAEALNTVNRLLVKLI